MKKRKILCNKRKMYRIYRILAFRLNRNTTEALVLALDIDTLNLFNFTLNDPIVFRANTLQTYSKRLQGHI